MGSIKVTVFDKHFGGYEEKRTINTIEELGALRKEFWEAMKTVQKNELYSYGISNGHGISEADRSRLFQPYSLPMCQAVTYGLSP